MQQRTSLTTYKECTTGATHRIERLRHENAILRSGTHPPSEQDCKLQKVYHRLSNAENGWNHTYMLLNITHEEVETRTHEIVHLEHHVEVQDAELEERAETITNLEQAVVGASGVSATEPVDLQKYLMTKSSRKPSKHCGQGLCTAT
jgi:DNA polymerase sigma